MLQFDDNFSDKGIMFRPFNASWPLSRRILRKLTYRSLLQQQQQQQHLFIPKEN